MARLKDLLKKPDLAALKRQYKARSVDFIEKRFPDRFEKVALLDAARENDSLLGAFIQMQLRMLGCWALAWAGVMALLLFLNIFIHPHHPHFVIDAYWGFWAVFGLGVGLVMVFVMKRIVQPLIVRKEDYYGDI